MLLTAILTGIYAPGSTLPSERTLAAQLKVTRPTLRELLQRLAREGWLTIRQGKPTLVNDYWRDGGLNVLNTLTSFSEYLPPDFVSHLLEARLALAPAYIEAAVRRSASDVVTLLTEHDALGDTPDAFAAFDWRLHRTLTVASGNPIFMLILNGFSEFYKDMARHYFAQPEARERSRVFYRALLNTARSGDPAAASEVSRIMMQDAITLWERTNQARSEQTTT